MYDEYLVGKYDNGKWAPLVVHLRDTVEVMKRLLRYWVSDSQIIACHIGEEEFKKVAILAAGTHDLGKATAYFQGYITEKCPQIADILESEGFALYNGTMYRGKTPHAHAGQMILQNYFGVSESFADVIGAHHGNPAPEAGINGTDNMLKAWPVNFFGREKDKEQERIWSSVWKKIVEDALQEAAFQSVEDIPELPIEAQVIISALLIMADWIASNTYYFPLIPLNETGDRIDFDERIRFGWDKLMFPQSWESEVNRMNGGIFAERFGFLPNDLQSAVCQIVNEAENPGIIIIEAQMGIGKTEAALGAAEVLANKCHSNGIFFGLPTQATCNGIYDRLYQWADTVSEDTLNAIKLAHSGAMYDPKYLQQVMQGQAVIDEEEADSQTLVHPWFNGNKKALLADFVIGTVDQLLMAALKKKHFMLRHLGLVGKVIIVDECHSYDQYMDVYLKESLKWLGAYKTPVILLSATLPSTIRKEFVEGYLSGCKVRRLKIADDISGQDWANNRGYPLITWTDGNVIHQQTVQQKVTNKRVKINYSNGKTGVIDALREKLQKGGCACVILNTVNSAQDYYQSIKNALPDKKIMLYHAEFTMEDRLKKEKELMDKMGKGSNNEDRDGFILVGTQVLEQSLDYDADVMFTQLCPIDLFLQRIGRLHRHKRTDKYDNSGRPMKLQNPECYVILEDVHTMQYDEGSGKIYGDYLLMRTKKVLSGYISIPEDIPELVQKVYNDSDDLELACCEEYVQAKQCHQKLQNEKKEAANTFLLKKPRILTGLLTNANLSEEKGEQSVRDTDTSIEVILLKREDKGICLLQSDVKKRYFRTDEMPDEEGCISIARQRLRLPGLFSRSYFIREVIHELSGRQSDFVLWKESSWMKGELILLLDSQNKTELCGYQLYYDNEVGLKYQKKEG